jgi:hypothetical protein
VLYENWTHRSPSIVAENSNTGLKSAIDFASMSVDELWKYRESIDDVLKAKIAIELTELNRRLDLLNPKPMGEAPIVSPGSAKVLQPGRPIRKMDRSRKPTALGSDAA